LFLPKWSPPNSSIKHSILFLPTRTGSAAIVLVRSKWSELTCSRLKCYELSWREKVTVFVSFFWKRKSRILQFSFSHFSSSKTFDFHSVEFHLTVKSRFLLALLLCFQFLLASIIVQSESRLILFVYFIFRHLQAKTIFHFLLIPHFLYIKFPAY
jgi:hypothetical protein